jgi:hypothetical protein
VIDAERVRWARALVLVGWLFLLAYLGIVASLVRRATAIRTASFEDGLWWQRVEQISQSTIPQNVVVLAPATAAGVVGALLVRSVVDRSVLRLAQLVRVIAGVCVVVTVIATLGIVGIFFRQPDAITDLQSMFLRLGGMLMAIGMLRLCWESEQAG